MSAPNSRKRAAPGASPMVPFPQRMQQPYGAENGLGNPMVQWNGGDGTEFIDTTGQVANPYGLMPAQQQFGQVPTPSNSLARRDMNQALVPANIRGSYDNAVEPWTGFGDDNALMQQGNGEGLVQQDNVEALEELAQKAKREAQSKRKQIPPFVQKLSSFLEEGRNEELIRWSEKGDSFIVLDEDEFAKTLIPELFKHNKYASFVRQLNMYGFHKRVGLSDNSMRASERKNKSPSEYHNPFFRRGHPNLLWLINKPKSKSKKGGKNAEGDSESEEEVGQGEGSGQTGGSSSTTTGRSLPAPASASTSSDAPPVQKKEMGVIKEELSKVRDQQKMILNAINRLQRNNNDLYNQALMFQNQHDRHQNSINAILNFLANVFRKTLEDQGNTQSVSDIISSMITNQGQPNAHQGSVVDLGDFFQTQMDSPTTPLGGNHKRARGLLPPIPNQNASTPSNRSASTGSTPYYPVNNQNPEMGTITELVEGSETPPNLRQELENNPHERMMKIINDHNATNKSGMDLPEAAELVNNAPNTLNRDQRSKLVDFMAGQSTSPPSAPMDAAAHTSAPAGRPPPQSSTRARVSPAPAEHAAPPSLSPIMRSPQMQPPSLNEINTNQIDLAQLQQLQREQDAKIHELSEMLGPLSPSGHIPGLEDGSDSYFDPPNVDLDQFFDSNAFLNDTNFGTDGNDFNFNLDADGKNISHNNLGNTDVNNTPSTTGTEEIERDDLNDSPDNGSKRRRVG